jgi:hypothetical protein
MSGRTLRFAVVGAVAAAGLALGIVSVGQGAGTPANKVWVAADSIDILTAGCTTPVAGVCEDKTQDKVLTGQGRFSSPTDLRISVTSECALWTNTATTGNDDSEAKARVEMWVTLDNKVVPVAGNDNTTDNPALDNTGIDPNDPAQPGRVVFCNRANRMKTENFSSDDNKNLIIRSFNSSREANAFNFGALNVGVPQDKGGYDDPSNGKGILDIEVHARLADSLTDTNTSDKNAALQSPYAKAGIGKRTLFVEPVHMAHTASF